MNDADDDRIKQAVHAELNTRRGTAPSFESSWREAALNAAAQTEDVGWHLPMAASAGVIVLAALMVFSVTPPPGDADGGGLGGTESTPLIAALTRSARWQAPSDRILDDTTALLAWGLPRLEWPERPNSIEGEADET